jgi:hypothetical protein
MRVCETWDLTHLYSPPDYVIAIFEIPASQLGSPLSAPSAATAALENEDDRAVRALREINEFDGGRALDADMEDDVLIAH